ncbi:MAG TPA: thiosulfate oxidation carrier complex protein SoxZ [Arcobacter sp.]|nr:thiosulfate oxidation carrier complex protein SoxZ [Arcobacter sp.]
MKIKAKSKKGKTTVKAMIKHEQLSYQEAERAKKKANFITHLTASVDGTVVYEMSGSQFLSKDPYLKFSFDGEYKGKKLEISAKDLLGGSKTSKGKIK